MNWIIRLFHSHKWEVLRIWHYLDISYDTDGSESTRATLQCKICGKIKWEVYYNCGYLTSDEINFKS